MNKPLVIALCGFALHALSPLPVLAQSTYPSKPINLIMAGGPGTTMDVNTRLFTGTITQQTGVQMNIDDKGGAGGTIGAA